MLRSSAVDTSRLVVPGYQVVRYVAKGAIAFFLGTCQNNSPGPSLPGGEGVVFTVRKEGSSDEHVCKRRCGAIPFCCSHAPLTACPRSTCMGIFEANEALQEALAMARLSGTYVVKILVRWGELAR